VAGKPPMAPRLCAGAGQIWNPVPGGLPAKNGTWYGRRAGARRDCCPEAVGPTGWGGRFKPQACPRLRGLDGEQGAAKGVTVVDDGTHGTRAAVSLSIDDRGTPPNRTVLIEDGILVGATWQDRQKTPG